MKRNIVLKNGLNVTLNCKVDVEGFFISAQYNGEMIACCQFYIFKIFSRKLDALGKEKYAKMHKIPLTEVPDLLNLMVDVFSLYEIEDGIPNPNKEKLEKNANFKINNNTLTMQTGNKYVHTSTKCELINIEIFNNKFLKIGLGQQMLELMEEIAKLYSPSQIFGLFNPHGELSHATISFYKRNDYSIIKQDSSLYNVEKNLIEN